MTAGSRWRLNILGGHVGCTASVVNKSSWTKERGGDEVTEVIRMGGLYGEMQYFSLSINWPA
jgi:hypothetical protein